MQYYVTLTSNCNLRCRYCYGKCCDDFGVDLGALKLDYSVPSSIRYDLTELERFCGKDPDPTIVLYGGEPLLSIDLLEKVIQKVPANKFILQTNGILLHKLKAEYLNKLDTVLVSIDGSKEITDYYRGKGVYEQVIKEVELIRKRGFTGEVIARMTVGRETKIDREVWSLLMDEDLFNSVHWQLDALFWHNDYDNDGFMKWVNDDYNPGVSLLIDKWVRYMKDCGKVLRIYPLVGVAQSLLSNEPTKLRCGAGWTMFNIQTDGNITPCPVMAGLRDFYLGNIRNTDSSDLVSRTVSVAEPCINCEIYTICGGRCLYANITKLWGEEGFQLVCTTVHNLIEGLKDAIPTIRHLISERRIHLRDFSYPKYNSCEIIP